VLRDCRKAGTTVASIDSKRLMNLDVPFPGLVEQRRIVDVLEDHLSRLDAGDTELSNAKRRAINLERSRLGCVFSTSEVDDIPLSELVLRIESGKSFATLSRPAASEEWGIIKVSAMTWGQFRPSENKAIPAEKADKRYEIRPGDLLVSRANTNAYVGASVLVGETRSRLLLSDKSLRLITKSGFRRDWLQLALSAPQTRSQISALATGTKDSMRNISQKALLSVKVPEHKESAQVEIVARLNQQRIERERLIQSIDTAAKRSASLRQALLQAAFTGKLTGHSSDMDRIEELAYV